MPVDVHLFDADLTERVDEVCGVGDVPLGPADDRKLAGERIRAPETVDLPAIGRAEYLQDEITALDGIARKVFVLEEDGFARASPQDRALD